MSRVLVTGAAGFVGSHLTASLRSEGHEVYPIVRAARAPGDVTMSELLAGQGPHEADIVVHAAAVRHRYGASADTYRSSNIELIGDLLRRAKAMGCRRFVLVSSVGVYGFPTALPITERHRFAPRTLYSATKVHAEKAARLLAAELDLELVIVRPTIVYGPGDRHGMLDKLADVIAARRYLIVGPGTNVLHHTHVDDVVRGLTLAAFRREAAGEDFILAGPETTTLAELSRLVAAELRVRLPRMHLPLPVARLAASAIDLAAYRGWAFVSHEPPVNHDKLDVMTVSIAFDPAKARALLGYEPRVRYEEGVRRTLAARGTSPS
ncbi:MAG: NAD(P)-dependent oxidoreductase [Myxococcales bacterium]|nr:NAD(P)-dependent oxidoreductase [Myxococcales bacterium]